MRTFLMLLLAFAIGAPLFAQEAEKKDPPKEEKKEERAKDAAEDTRKEEGEAKREMTADGKKLYADVELVYAKFYEIALAKVKANEAYKSDDVWNEAVKEAKNAKYKDSTEFHDAITKMKAKDRAFKKDVNELSNKSAKDFAAAVEEWSKEKK